MIDRHHLLFSDRRWSSDDQALALRSDHTLIPRLDRGVHEALHRECAEVPLLGHLALMYVNDSFVGDNNPLKSLDNLSQAIEASAQRPNMHLIDRELAYLAAYSLQMQKPFIREGLDRSWE